MTNLFLTNTAADAAVTAGSGTKWKAAFAAGASAVHLNKNTVVGPTAPLQMTNGAAGVDGTVVSWYTEPLAAGSLSGAITASLWTRENATANNVAPTLRIERTDGAGNVLSTIVSETVNHGAGECATTAGGASDVISVSAANVTDTSWVEGDRLRITLYIDDASGQGGTGSMASGGRGEMWVNGPNSSQGQSQIATTEDVSPMPPAPTGQVTYLDSTTTGDTQNTTSLNVAMPNGGASALTTMDVVIVEISRWPGGGSPPTVNNGGGFISIGSVVAGDGNQRMERFAKRLTGPMSGNVTFNWASTSMWSTAQATGYRGVDRDVDLTTLSSTAVNTGTTFASVSRTGVPEGSALHFHGTNETVTGTGHVAPTGFTEAEDTDCDTTAYRNNVAAGDYTVSDAAVGANSVNNLSALMTLPPEPSAGGPTSVGKDLAVAYHALAVVGDDLTLAYDVRGVVFDTLAVAYDVRAVVGDSLAIAYDVDGPVGKNLAIAYNVSAIVGDTLETLWQIRQTAGRDAVLLWDARANLGDTLLVAWDVRSAIGDVLVLSWDVRVVLGDTITLLWDARSSIGQNLTLAYNVESEVILVAKDLTIVWSADGPVAKDLSVVWEAREVLGKSLSVAWDTRAVIGDVVALSWAIRSIVGDSQSLLWDVRAIAGDDLVVSWHASTVADKELTVIWHVESDVPEQLYVIVAEVLPRWRTGVNGRRNGVVERWAVEVVERWRMEVRDENS